MNLTLDAVFANVIEDAPFEVSACTREEVGECYRFLKGFARGQGDLWDKHRFRADGAVAC